MKEGLGRLGKGGPDHRGFLISDPIMVEVEILLESSIATGTCVGMTTTRPKRDESRETMMELVPIRTCVCVCVCVCLSAWENRIETVYCKQHKIHH